MTEPPFSWDSVPYTRLFPWLRFQRVFWIALDPRQLVLALLAMGVWWCGLWVLDNLLSGSEAHTEAGILASWHQATQETLPAADEISTRDLPTLLSLPLTQPLAYFWYPLRPWWHFEATWFDRGIGLVMLFWAMLVWSLFGGAMGRIAALRLARRQQLGLLASLRYSGSRLLDYFAAPGLPLFGIVICLLLCAAVSSIGLVPTVGPWLLGLALGGLLLLGFAMLILWLGVIAGWPLMVAAINVEGCDGFEGFSRSYNYLIERAWQYAAYTLLLMIHGGLTFWVVRLALQSLWLLMLLGVSMGPGGGVLMGTSGPASHGTTEHDMTVHSVEAAELPLLDFWGAALFWLARAYLHSHFWTATTLIYFLLRRGVDANDFDEIHRGDQADADDLLPLVGVAAMQAASTRAMNPVSESAAATPTPQSP